MTGAPSLLLPWPRWSRRLSLFAEAIRGNQLVAVVLASAAIIVATVTDVP
ncbi:MAG: hypothetical protein WKF76_03570 [Nocardioidaceae bacterium]